MGLLEASYKMKNLSEIMLMQQALRLYQRVKERLEK